MPTTEPDQVANVGWNGSSETTEITNDQDNVGFPAETKDGELVFIARTTHDGTTKVMTTADGVEYVDDGITGKIVLRSEYVSPALATPLYPNVPSEAEAVSDEEKEATFDGWGESKPADED